MTAITAVTIVLVSLVLILAALDVASIRWGADSREPMLDDYRR
jgi:hypothetical protein